MDLFSVHTIPHNTATEEVLSCINTAIHQHIDKCTIVPPTLHL